ncbi:MAG: DsbA family protein [Sphingobacteriia bacterium 24-36-13]|uniref:DsbA family protein n=1 Tax=Sediminibacterium sp. TaxID=1917865 RepID=UPI000BD46932|nr:DsbA family protein [Sediminibacterium sp.]OYY10613.1 MAG: DsbA family protein [Sphingobacteriia bacterium 35-36-14]OYZ52674.1 MAG: DsbA family protein [Sphingobacteriia bacterium 24-36-13]OZA64893.1 MAG: DsbA family protein [Sphingobacteriia bacterium 39-36-14]HQS24443.1 DsbA family protein [Sediminibacterium sp.]HQS35991.1 DsbA family protein [Sediminibacterium sp.]
MKPILFYCYDAYCGWCYGFSRVMTQIANHFPDLQIEVLSGGMILPEEPVHISATAGYIQSAYKTVEEYSGVSFGPDYLWHINNPDLSDWYPHSEKPAIALSIFKEIYPEKQAEFAADLQKALHFEGRDLTDDEAYKHLLEKYSIQPELFYERLKSEEYKEKANYEFALVKQLQVTGYPCVLLQESETKFHLLARGYTPYPDLKARLERALQSIQ